VRGNLVPKIRVKKKENAQKERDKEKGVDMIDVPNKLLEQAIKDAERFFNDEPQGAEVAYEGI
jgi:hypothetical protein